MSYKFNLICIIILIVNHTQSYGSCGDRSVNGPLGFRVGSGLLGQWPISDHIPDRGHPGPRQNSSEDDRF